MRTALIAGERMVNAIGIRCIELRLRLDQLSFGCRDIGRSSRRAFFVVAPEQLGCVMVLQ